MSQFVLNIFIFLLFGYGLKYFFFEFVANVFYISRGYGAVFFSGLGLGEIPWALEIIKPGNASVLQRLYLFFIILFDLFGASMCLLVVIKLVQTIFV